jgi:hypothetical protein
MPIFICGYSLDKLQAAADLERHTAGNVTFCAQIPGPGHPKPHCTIGIKFPFLNIAYIHDLSSAFLKKEPFLFCGLHRERPYGAQLTFEGGKKVR